LFARGIDFASIFVSPPLFIEVPVPSQEYVFLLGALILPLSLYPVTIYWSACTKTGRCLFVRGIDFASIFVSPPLLIEVPVPSQEDVCLLGVLTLPLSLYPRHFFLLMCLFQARKMFVC
jgi:hypothetical protein